jgi:hypothetical protein
VPSPGRVERRAPAFLPVPRELDVIPLPRHADDNAPDAEPATEELAKGGDNGRRAGRNVAPGASREHGEEDVATLAKVVGH